MRGANIFQAVAGIAIALGCVGCATIHEINGEGILPPPPAGSSNQARSVLSADEVSASAAKAADDSAARDVKRVEPPFATDKARTRHFFYDPKDPRDRHSPEEASRSSQGLALATEDPNAFRDTAYHNNSEAVDTVLVRLAWGAVRRHLVTGQHLPIRPIVWPYDVVVQPRSGGRVVDFASQWVPLSRFASNELDCVSTNTGQYATGPAARVVMSLVSDDTSTTRSLLYARGEIRGATCRVGEDWINRVSGVSFDVWMDMDRAVGVLVHPRF